MLHYAPMDTPNLTRLGHLLIDLNAVRAIAPLRDDPSDGYGFRVLTIHGAFDVKDQESSEAIHRHFYLENDSRPNDAPSGLPLV